MANIIFHAAFEKFGENIMQTDQSYALSLPMLDLIEMAWKSIFDTKISGYIREDNISCELGCPD